jgi:hypothetical protein
MKWETCLKKVIREKLLLEKFIPTPELLDSLQMDRLRFYNVMNNISKMNAYECVVLADWLGVHPRELIEIVREDGEEQNTLTPETANNI